MRLYHIAAIVLVVTLVGFVGCKKDRAGVTYYPTPPAVVTAPPQPAPPPEYAPAPAPGQPHAPPPPEYVPAPAQAPQGTSPAAPAAGSMAQPAAGSTTQDSMAPEVLTRGPLHEAFAEPVTYNPQPGLVAPRQPPAVVEEMPPDEQPQGAVWIPGYWAWDDDRSDFLWVSGIWRVPPPNCSWVPGYWTQVAGGWQWTSGFWMANQTREITYLPTPPASLELGPSSPPPSDNYIWATGCWNWSSDRYLWRPGYWMAAQPSWVWVPAHHVWTPRGYVFVTGYWDYPLENRGLVFAPVYFRPAVYAAPIYYSPVVVIDSGLLSFNLFTQPRYCCYYFGDYYAVEYAQVGIYPWFEFHRHHTWYDPIYEHRRWSFRQEDPQWSQHLRARYALLRSNPAARPPRTFAAQRAEIGKVPEVQRKEIALAKPLPEVVAAKATAMKFEALDKSRREDVAKRAKELEKYRGERARWENPQTVAKAPTGSGPPTLPLMPSMRMGGVAQPSTMPAGPTAVKPPEMLGKQPAPVMLPKETKKPETTGPLPTGPKPPVVMPKQPLAVRPPAPPAPPAPIRKPESPGATSRVIERPPVSAPPTISMPAPTPRVIERPPAPMPPPTISVPAPTPRVIERPSAPTPPTIRQPAPPAPRFIERPQAPTPPPTIRQPDPPAPRVFERPPAPSPPPAARQPDSPAPPRAGGPGGPASPSDQPNEMPRRR
jgi:hypothetical protein